MGPLKMRRVCRCLEGPCGWSQGRGQPALTFEGALRGEGGDAWEAGPGHEIAEALELSRPRRKGTGVWREGRRSPARGRDAIRAVAEESGSSRSASRDRAP